MPHERSWSKVTNNFDRSQVEDLGIPNVSIDVGVSAVIVNAIDGNNDQRLQNLDIMLRSQGFNSL